MYEYVSDMKMSIFGKKENTPSFVENNLLAVQLQENYLISLYQFSPQK